MITFGVYVGPINGGGGKLKGDFSIFQIPEGGYFGTSFNVLQGVI